jgi:hypothetical protein
LGKKNEGQNWTFKLLVETNSHWKYLIWAKNDEQIFDFVAVETNVVILPFGAILAYATIPKSLLLMSKWSNQKQSCHARLKCIFWVSWPLQVCHQLDMFPNLGLFCAFNLVLFWDW